MNRNIFLHIGGAIVMLGMSYITLKYMPQELCYRLLKKEVKHVLAKENKVYMEEIQQDKKREEVINHVENKPVQEVIKPATPIVEEKKDEAHVLNVPLIQQYPELARGCEVTSLAMLLQHAGVEVTKMKLASQIKKVPFRNGDLHGNPHEGQVGDIYTFDQSGYGVYHEPIFKLAQTYLGDRVRDMSGEGIGHVYEALRNGTPVWVITNSTFAPLQESSFEKWNTKEGVISITYREHSVVIVGYDEKHVYINDPLHEKKARAVHRKNFEEAWIQMGKQAITYIS